MAISTTRNTSSVENYFMYNKNQVHVVQFERNSSLTWLSFWYIVIYTGAPQRF